MRIPIPKNSDFTLHNLPFGIFSTPSRTKRIGVAVGEHILDLAAVAQLNVFDFDLNVFNQSVLNNFIALGKATTNNVRTNIQQWLQVEKSPISDHLQIWVKQSEATMHLPLQIGDYTDFYSSIEHATNVGKMFRDPDKALLPNWKHLPVGYHGRTSSIVVSGQNIHRPKGQILPKGANAPIFKATEKLDFELEMAFVIGKNSTLGQSISTAEAEDYIFGMALFNDWSARDIQKWEYVPLGPFLGKSFASSMSPWIVTMEALELFRVAGPKQQLAVLPYLRYEGPKNYDIDLSVSIQPQDGQEHTVAQSNFKYMYWNMAQQLAHHTSNGCNVNVGDLMASGTISGKEEDSYGSMLELSWGGTKPIALPDGTTRTFLEDYDTVTMRGSAQKGNVRVGFGEVKTTILPTAKNNF
ncbi:MAG: fumarylacetoacetase [Bacteroidota bacterium]